MACFGKPGVLVTYTRDCLLQVMKNQRCQEVKACHDSAVDQRTVPFLLDFS
jgi:hypothetical protein